MKAVLQYARAGESGGKLEQIRAVACQHVYISSPQSLQTSRCRVDGLQFSSLQNASQRDLTNTIPGDRDANPGLVRVADVADRGASRHQICVVHLQIRRGEVDLTQPTWIEP